MTDLPRLFLRSTLVVMPPGLTACGTSERTEAGRTPTAVIALSGAGATFPYPVYTRGFSRHTEAGGARINYRSISSGAGIRALLADSLGFAATDAPLDRAERVALAARGIRQVPLVVGGAAVTNQIPGLAHQLRLDGTTLAAMFLGRITRWNDARVVALNPDIDLPAEPIRVITRADTSGTSWIITEYLSGQRASWATGPGRSRFPDWPAGTGGARQRRGRGHVGLRAVGAGAWRVRRALARLRAASRGNAHHAPARLGATGAIGRCRGAWSCGTEEHAR